MRILFLVPCLFCAILVNAQLPIIHYDSGRITINGAAVSKATRKTALETILGSKARSGNLAHIGDPITGDRSKQPFKYTYIFDNLGFSVGWFNQPPHNIECFFLLQKTEVPKRRDKRLPFSGTVFIGDIIFSSELNLKNITSKPGFAIVATGLGDPKHPYTLISYQNTILKCRFNEAGFLTDFGTHL